MQKYNKYALVYYTADEAIYIRSLGSKLESGVTLSELVTNKDEFLKSARQVAAEDNRRYFLSINREDSGRHSLHLHPGSGYVNLDVFDVEGDIILAALEADDYTFEYLIFEFIEAKIANSCSRIQEGDHVYDAEIAILEVTERFGLDNFPEVELAEGYEIDPEVYKVAQTISTKIDNLAVNAGASYADCLDFLDSMICDVDEFCDRVENLYLAHLEEEESQLATFEPALRDGKLCFTQVTQTESARRKKQATNYYFSIWTSDDLAVEYEITAQTESRSKALSRLSDMYIAVAADFVLNFEEHAKPQEKLFKNNGALRR